MSKKTTLFLVVSAFLIYAAGFWLAVSLTQHAGRRANRLISLINLQQSYIVESASGHLEAWSKDLQAHGSLLNSPCASEVISVIDEDDRYTTYGVVNKNGDVVCTKDQDEIELNLADRPYIQQAFETKELAMSGFQVGRITGNSVVAYAYPVFNDNQEVEQLVFLGVDLHWMNDVFVDLDLPQGSEVVVADPQGRIEIYYPSSPELIGQPIFQPRIFSIILSNKSGNIKTEGLDNKERKYFYGALQLDKDEAVDAFLLVGTPNRFMNSDDTIMFILGGVVLAAAQLILFKRI